jgi:ammonia channel protein AmtB
MDTNVIITPNGMDYAGGTVIHLTWPVSGLVFLMAIVGVAAFKILRKRNSS